MYNLKIISSTVRPGRKGPLIAAWIAEKAKQHGGFNVEVLDLGEINLPMMNEAHHPSLKKYEHEHTKKWAAKIAEFDGYIWVTPEYNHSTSAALKNAIDYLYAEWNKKTVGIVSYGTVGGVRAAEHLKQIAGEMQMHDIRNGVYVLAPWAAFDENGDAKPENVLGDIAGFTDELIWWTDVLKTARA